MSIASLLDRLSKSVIDAHHPIASLLRWPRWVLANLIGTPVLASFATGGITMELTPRFKAFGSTAIFIRRDEYEPELLATQRLIHPGSTVIDIGGSYGIYSLFMAHFAGPEGRVYAFEPGTFSFERLTRNIALNQFEHRIIATPAAAAAGPATLKLAHFGGSPVNFSISPTADGVETEEVQALRVDSVVPPERWAEVSFIKIDVEGYEMAALEGARGIIEAAHPPIMFEVSHAALARQGLSAEDMFAFIRSFGYRLWMLDDAKRFVPDPLPVEGNIFAALEDLTDR